MLSLSLTEKGGPTKDLHFEKDEVTIGRVRGNDVILAKGNVSKHHCRLVTRDGQIYMEDLHSTNGTYVNGRKIAELTPVGPSDKIFVGDFVVRIKDATAATEASRALPAEAGSLSTALPRRPPPPPPASVGDRDDGLLGAGKARSPGKSPLAAPAISTRDTTDIPPFVEPIKPVPETSFPTDINLDDDDPLSTPRPKLQVPPLKPAFQPTPPRPGDSQPGLSHEAAEPFSGSNHPYEDDSQPPEPPLHASGDDVVESHFPPSMQTLPPATLPVSVDVSPPPILKPAKPASPKPQPPEARKNLVARSAPEYPEWLGKILDGEGVTAVYFLGGNQAEILRHGTPESLPVASADLMTLLPTVRKLVAHHPGVAADALTISETLGDGTHLSALFPPVTDRPCIVFRRSLGAGKTIEDLVDGKVISAPMRELLEASVASRRNILVAGDRAACDSILRALTWSLDRVTRVAVLSTTLTPPASATAWIKVQSSADPARVMSGVACLDPQYIVLDTSMSPLVGPLVSECYLGLEGAMISMVAQSSLDALARLEFLGIASGTQESARHRVAKGIDVVLYVRVTQDGNLKVVEIAEPRLDDLGRLDCQTLFTYRADSQEFHASHRPCNLASKLQNTGHGVSASVLTPLS